MPILNSEYLFHPKHGTIHINAKKNDIAKIVLMGGDPLRAKKMAKNYLKDPKLVSSVRNMLLFTGYYNKKKITIMGHGMGMPSMGIYAYEIIRYYGSETVIRFGTCGALRKEVNIGDIIIAQGACTDGQFTSQYNLPGTYTAISDFDLLEKVVIKAKKTNKNFHIGNIISSDLFYSALDTSIVQWGEKMGVYAVDMETYALYCLAAYFKKKALTILTVSDHLVNKNAIQMTPEERQNKTETMFEIILKAVTNFN